MIPRASSLSIVDLPSDAASLELLERFHRGIYLEAFAAQREPLEVWHAALRGQLPYALNVRLALDGDDIVGGITYELYPRSMCGLVTYLVVAPHARERGLGRTLLDGAARGLYASGARAVLGEVNDPRVHGDAAWPRLQRFVGWGAKVLDHIPYVQPSLGPGLDRDRGLCLILLPPIPAVADEVIQTFVRELYLAAEGTEPSSSAPLA